MGMLTTKEYETIAENLTFNTKALINGKLVEARNGKTFDTVNPANGKVTASITSCGAEEVDEAVQAARAAFDSGKWSRIAPQERKQMLFAFADLIEAHAEELAVMKTIDSGKPICDTVEGALIRAV